MILVNNELSTTNTAKTIKTVRVNGENILLKRHNSKNYKTDKHIYILLKDDDFLPVLKYHDDVNCILGMTDVGVAIPLYKRNNNNWSLKQYDSILTNIVDILYNKYNLYHNDLEPKNICIDHNNKIRLIDFDRCSNKKHQSKYHLNIIINV